MNWEVDRVVVVKWGLLEWLPIAQMHFMEMCRANKLRVLACNLHGGINGGIKERLVRAIMPGGVELQEMGFFNRELIFYTSRRKQRVRLEERKMVQIRAYKEIVDEVVDAVAAERKSREKEMALSLEGEDEGQGSAGFVNPLVVKWFRLVQ